MRMDKLTNQLQMALADAQSLAVGKDHNYIEPVHLLSALLDQQGGSSRPLLQKAGADIAGLAAGVAAAVDALPTVSGTAGEVHMSNDLGRILNVTDKLAQQGGDTYISSELVLLAMLEPADGGPVIAAHPGRIGVLSPLTGRCSSLKRFGPVTTPATPTPEPGPSCATATTIRLRRAPAACPAGSAPIAKCRPACATST